jgi:hypothetical protein
MALTVVMGTFALVFSPMAAAAETSIYVVDQPEIFLVVEVKGEDGYVAYLEAESLCYGAGAHRSEEPNVVTHRAFETGPVRLRPIDGGYRLLRRHGDLYESRREELRLEIGSDRIAGTYSAEASGEAIQGKCETNAPNFEPEFGQSEPPISFEARPFVPLGSPAATLPDPAAEALYFQASRQIETIFWADDGTVAKVRGVARETCRSRRGKPFARRRELEPGPPFSIDPATGGFEGRGGREWPYLSAASHLEASASASEVLGRYRAGIAYRNGRRKRFYEWCGTGARGGDGYVSFHAFRYVPAAPVPGGAQLRPSSEAGDTLAGKR